MRLGRFGEAAPHFAQATELDPTDQDAKDALERATTMQHQPPSPPPST